MVWQTARVTAVLEEGEEEDIVIDDDLLKLVSKRKLKTRQSSSRAKKASKEEEMSQSQGQDSLFDSNEDKEKISTEGAYSAITIKKSSYRTQKV